MMSALEWGGGHGMIQSFLFPSMGISCNLLVTRNGSYHEFQAPLLQPGEELVAACPLVLLPSALVVLFTDVDLAQVEHPRFAQLPRQGLSSSSSAKRKKRFFENLDKSHHVPIGKWYHFFKVVIKIGLHLAQIDKGF